MNLKPLSDHIIVRPLAKKEKSTIVLPDTKDEKPETGEVLAVGPGRILDNGTRLKMDVKVGDKIIFKKYAPDEITIEDEDCLVLSESSVVAIVG